MATVIIRLDEYYVVFGTSSGQIILNRLNFAKRRLEQIENDNCYDAAVLCMRKLTSESLVATGFTDGTVLIKKLHKGGIFTSITRINAHAFGVNCLDIRRIEGERMLICTGGDDQQVKLHILNMAGELQSEHGSMSHSSVVKGVFAYAEGNNVQVVSSSYDQRVKEWCWDGTTL